MQSTNRSETKVGPNLNVMSSKKAQKTGNRKMSPVQKIENVENLTKKSQSKIKRTILKGIPNRDVS